MESIRQGRLVVAIIAAAAVVAFAVAPAADAANGGVDLKIKSTKQAKLASSGKVRISVSGGEGNATVSVALDQDKKKTKVAKTNANLGGQQNLSLKLNDDGKRLVQSCMKTGIVVTAKGKGGKLGQAKATMKRDAKRCDGDKPAGVDLANGDRCDFITAPGEECLFPYPNDYYTRPDSTTDTGLRLNLNPESTPANKDGVHIDPTDINGSDGFSPGALIVLHVPGMDTPDALAKTGAVPITAEGESFDKKQPVVLIDADTGERQLIWAELDSNATSPTETDLLIHPAKNLTDGHRYIVALRNLKNAAGKTIPAPEGFRLYRDDIPTGVKAIEKRRKHFESIF